MQQNPSPQPDDIGKIYSSKQRKPKPFAIEYRRMRDVDEPKTEWAHWRSYSSIEGREQALDGLIRKYSHIRYEFRAAE